MITGQLRLLAICTNQRPSDLLPANQRPVLQGHVTSIGQSEASIAGEDRNTIEEVTDRGVREGDLLQGETPGQGRPHQVLTNQRPVLWLWANQRPHQVLSEGCVSQRVGRVYHLITHFLKN